MTTQVGATSSLSSPSASGGTSTGSSQTLGKDAFLKLLMAQLSNQDPTQPTDGTQFVTQLAQFSLVEQSVSQTTQLSNIGAQLQGLSNSDATALVGKTVTAQGGSMTWDGTFATTANVSLGAPAQSVSVQVQDAQGNTVRTMSLGAEPTGTLPITWNGMTDAGQAAPPGTYSIKVSATTSSGQTVPVSQTVTGVVTQVSFANGYPALTLSSGAVVPVSQLLSVGAAPTTPPTTPTNP